MTKQPDAHTVICEQVFAANNPGRFTWRYQCQVCGATGFGDNGHPVTPCPGVVTEVTP